MARLCAIAVAVLALSAVNAHAGDGKTVVLRPAASGETRRGHLDRLEKSLERAARKQPFTVAPKRHTPTRSCAADAVCLAAKGAKLGAARVVGILVHRKRSRFTVSFLVVDVASKGGIANHELVTSSRRALEQDGGDELLAALAKATTPAPTTPTTPTTPTPTTPTTTTTTPTTPTPPAPPTPPTGAAPDGSLVASGPATVRGDGRTPVTIAITGSPAPREGELEQLPEPAAVDCDHALSLPGDNGRAPAVIAPAVRQPRAVTCKVTHRDATTEFSFRAEPPTQPGIYVEVARARHLATDGTVAMTAFVVDEKGRVVPPTVVHAAASAGEISTGDRGQLTLTLPDSRAPRVITIALTDGSHTGAAFVPIWGVTKLDVEAERRSKVNMRIAGRWVEGKYARRGYVQLAIEVPPGVAKGVVRATRRGASVESIADLELPQQPRLAAVALSPQVPASGSTSILIAGATEDGRPALADTAFETRAKVGSLGSPVARGPGLWQMDYTATAALGNDELVIRIKRDRKAGRIAMPLAIVAGAAEVIDIELPDRTYLPGEPITAAAIIRDSQGNVIERAPTATIGSQTLAVEPGTTGFSLTGHLPEKLPPNGPLELVVQSGTLVGKKVVRARADVPVSARIRARGGSRAASLEVEVRDRHGNVVGPKAFTLVAPAARPGPLTRDGDVYRGRLFAAGGARETRVEVRAGDQVLTSTLLRFEPPPSALLVGAYGDAGWVTSSGDFAAPRLGVGIGVRRFLGPIEFALSVGAEGFSFSDSEQAMIGGVMRELSREVIGVSVPVKLRARRPLTDRLGVSLEGAVVPTRVGTTLGSDFQADQQDSHTVIGGRARLAVDWRWGMRRANLGVGYGVARLDDGPITGSLEGLTFGAGFEWWFVDLGGE